MIDAKINLPKRLESRLNYLEIVSKRPKDFYIKKALIRYLEDMEDIQDALEVSNRKEKTYTTEELKKN